MRLLNCQSKLFEEFLASPPPYAILSHTWEKEELNFGNMMAALQSMASSSTTTLPPSITNMQGWFKIESSCTQALADGYAYVWVDTICIDKTSSAELTEAINSMYQWYRDAAVCYVYLYDITLSADDMPDVLYEFRKSRWFTRGWTLQEMIAPRNLYFYGKRWQPLGDQTAHLDELVAITGVDERVLIGTMDVRLCSIARIMSWASKRTTTRIEDTAYALLGLFEISMPLLYGEGKRAFRRLQEELIKEYDDHSIFAWCLSDVDDEENDSPTGVLAESPAAFALSANVAPAAIQSKQPMPPIAWTSYGVHIYGMGCFTTRSDRLYFQLSCSNIPMSPQDWPRETPIVLFLEMTNPLDRRCTRLKIFGLPKPSTSSPHLDQMSPMDIYIVHGPPLSIFRSKQITNQRAFDHNAHLSI